MTIDDRLARAHASLAGLAVGDALGAQFFVPANLPLRARREIPPGPWPWTDDTEMACSVVAVLRAHGAVDQDALARLFARHHDFDRGYGPGVNRMLRLVRGGGDWRALAAGQFDGAGSWGNGAAMRVAPLGAWFAGDPEAAAREAAASAAVTHTHPEGVAGAVAVAVAAALAPGHDGGPGAFLARVREFVPGGVVRDRIGGAERLAGRTDPAAVGRILGNGRRVSAPDTVPFTLWAAAGHLDDFAGAFWATAAAGGDVDTTCAIVCGIVASRLGTGGVPERWLRRTEALPAWAGAPRTFSAAGTRAGGTPAGAGNGAVPATGTATGTATGPATGTTGPVADRAR